MPFTINGDPAEGLGTLAHLESIGSPLKSS